MCFPNSSENWSRETSYQLGRASRGCNSRRLAGQQWVEFYQDRKWNKKIFLCICRSNFRITSRDSSCSLTKWSMTTGESRTQCASSSTLHVIAWLSSKCSTLAASCFCKKKLNSHDLTRFAISKILPKSGFGQSCTDHAHNNEPFAHYSCHFSTPTPFCYQVFIVFLIYPKYESRKIKPFSWVGQDEKW